MKECNSLNSLVSFKMERRSKEEGMLHDATQMARPVANNNKGRTVMARVREIKPPGHPCFHSRLVYDHDLGVLSGK